MFTNFRKSARQLKFTQVSRWKKPIPNSKKMRNSMIYYGKTVNFQLKNNYENQTLYFYINFSGIIDDVCGGDTGTVEKDEKSEKNEDRSGNLADYKLGKMGLGLFDSVRTFARK